MSAWSSRLLRVTLHGGAGVTPSVHPLPAGGRPCVGHAPENGAAVGAFEAAVKAETGRTVKFLNATGVSDGRYYADDRIEIINFGPGSGAQGHAANESVPIAEMVEAAEIQLDVVQRLLG